MSYTLEHLHWAIGHDRVSLTVETAAFIVLSAAEQLQAAPRAIDNAAIMLTEAGSVLLVDGGAVSPKTCDEHLRGTLSQLVVQCGGEHPAVEAVVSGSPTGPAQLARELSAALIPINRSAARRGLMRLHRRLQAAGPPLDVRMPALRPVASAATPAAEAAPPAGHATIRPTTDRCGPSPQAAPVVELGHRTPAVGTAARTPPIPTTVDGATPFLGSIEVDPVYPATANSTPVALSDTPQVVAAVREVPPGNTDATASGTQAPARDGGNGVTRLSFGRFASRRSDVNALVDSFSIETATRTDLVADQLRRCIAGEPDTVCTPLAPAGAEGSR